MQSLKREAVLFDFFNGTEPDGTPRVADFRYYKTNGTASEKRQCTRSFEDITQIIIQPKPDVQKGGTKTAKTRETPHLKSNFMIRVRFKNEAGETDFRNLKIKLLTHYRPKGSADWFAIIHPSR
ncbi:hypothetical protein P1X15_10020 [Runella sp. MFBS21]|uniref:hypothetical protein n=1 Tax=Runella sp. MFBS21 TaxID=3034018 RepID=UPI0023F6CB0B|nr:hypothetical protein [Runella sp. MFBS21]MDF7817934.1 hypothetical protein [Runella sp. MFBS21]